MGVRDRSDTGLGGTRGMRWQRSQESYHPDGLDPALHHDRHHPVRDREGPGGG